MSPIALLDRLTRIFDSSLNPSVTLRLALVDIVKLLGATGGCVALINPETGMLGIEASVGFGAREKAVRLRLGEGIIGRAALHGSPARRGDASGDPRSVPLRRDTRSELAVPILREGMPRRADPAVAGVLAVESAERDAFDGADEERLVSLARRVSVLIHNAWLYDQARLKASRLDSLFQLGQSILQTDTLPGVLKRVAQGACRLMGARFGAVLMADAAGANLVWSAASDDRAALPRTKVPVDNSHIGAAVRRAKPVVVVDIRKTEPLPASIARRHRGLVSLLAVPLCAGGRAVGAVTVFMDQRHRFSDGEIQLLTSLASQAALVIQRGHLSEKLASTEEDLRQGERLSAVGLLAAEVAHEIRNPLTVIKMLAHSLSRGLEASDARREDFDVLGRKLDQMNRTVERVLGLARNSEPVFENQPIHPLIEDLALLTRHKMAQQRVKLVFRSHPSRPFASVDRAQMEQALLNIILNALHAMPRGGTLHIQTGIQRGRVWIEVRDSGSGMSDARRRKLFEPFLTTRRSGTGLGMAIVDKIVRAHHGAVQVRSRPGHGTHVRIILPAATETGP